MIGSCYLGKLSIFKVSPTYILQQQGAHGVPTGEMELRVENPKTEQAVEQI